MLPYISSGGANFKEAVKLRAKESGKNLKRKAAAQIAEMMKGSGYKALARKRRQQSRKTSGLVRIAVKKKKRYKRAYNQEEEEERK